MLSVGDRFTSDRGNGIVIEFLSDGKSYHVVFDDGSVDKKFPSEKIKIVNLIDL